MDFRLFFRKILLKLILPTVLFLTVYECIYRRIENPYSLKADGMNAQRDTLEVLILGNSHAYFGLNPIYFSRPAFNAANVSQDFRRNHFIFFHYATSMPHLHQVVITLSFSSLWELMEREGDSWRIRKYAIYMGDTSVPWYKLDWHFEFMSVGNRSLWDAFKGVDLLQCTPKGVYTGNRLAERAINWQETWEGPVGRHSHYLKSDSHTLAKTQRINDQYLEDILSYCQEKGIKVLLLTTPCWHTYYSHLNALQYEAMQAYAERVCSVYGITYLNLLKDKRFIEDDFFDTDHLNEQGAVKLSRMVDSCLKAEVHD